MKEEWKEGQEGTIPLPNDEPRVFDLYGQWLYRRTIPIIDSTIDSGKESTEQDLLVRAYAFGEKIQDTTFQNTILDALIMSTNTPDKQKRRWFPGRALVSRAYEGTPVGSPLRRLMVDLHNYHGDASWVEGGHNEEFLVDLVREMYKTRPRPTSADPTGSIIDSCAYHLHSDDGYGKACRSSTD